MTYRDLAVVKASEIEVDDPMPPYQVSSRCRKCHAQVIPQTHFEPAYRPSWLGRLFGRRARPERMRRECWDCKAVYYEKPLA